MNEPTPQPGWKAIAAVALNGVIGRGAEIPWHLPEDFRWFKETTMGGTLVMGRRTFESIGRPLPGRTTVVVSRTRQTIPGVSTSSSLDEVLRRDLPKPIFLCGGAQLYACGLGFCQELLLTRVLHEAAGDVWFPPFEHLFVRAEILRDASQFRIERWIRRDDREPSRA